MGKKIVVITGSPRKKGNTMAMAEAFIKEAEAKGHEVYRFDAAKANLGGCHACEQCYQNGKACAFDDDFNTLAPKILEADDIIFVMPVYWYSIPAQIKCVLDKFYSFCVAGKDVAGKGYGLIAACEENSMDVFAGIRIPLAKSADLLKWHKVAEVLVPGVYRIGEIDDTDGCERAARMADEL
ncbi:MAG: flavodoxin family protein [Acidaminococcus provencensis]|uniref:flavodoxin family protein n=1 Tax=Acidaminococcus TaxID=904 RepID=UPI000E53049B|nr:MULTISPECIES: flavodoxin family protein [Acidaminococcus]MCH4095549.1 flavodoxin family protein [Acidaminococcus provencensis]RHK00872.1 flavodoxin family protein [Acidaminococcus sp. AM05-11]